MKLPLKYISILGLLSIGSGEMVMAQVQQNSEVVMTKAELESFLANIANHKREQMAKRKSAYLLNAQFQEALNATQQSPAPTATDERVYRELERINNRIDQLMLSGGVGTRSIISGSVMPQQPATIVYQQERSAPGTSTFVPLSHQTTRDHPFVNQRNNSGNANGTTTTIIKENTTTPAPIENAETRRLQGQINVLTEEIRVLSKLGTATSSKDYDDEIATLKNRINELNEEVAKKNVPIATPATVVEEKSNPNLKELSNYQQKIFFANNSVALSSNDKANLAQLAKIVQQNDPAVTVVIRGFASNSGSAQYNNKISFNRAEAVKKVLMQNGLSVKHILTMHHGIDNSSSAADARRVEVTLMVH